MMKNSLNKTNLLLLRLSMYTRIHSSGNRQLSVWRKSKTMANNDKSQSHRLLHGWKSPHRTEGKQRHLTDRWSAYSKQTAQKNREEKGENWKQWQSLSPVSKMSFLKMAVGREKKKELLPPSTGKEETHSLSQGHCLPSPCRVLLSAL